MSAKGVLKKGANGRGQTKWIQFTLTWVTMDICNMIAPCINNQW